MKSVMYHPAPNIVPGLNLTAERFAELYAWIRATSADTALCVRRPYQYGLTIAYDKRPSLQLGKNGPQLILSRCCGITPAGSIIGHFEDAHAPLTLELSEQEMRPQEPYGIFLSVRHGQQRAFGPESADMPLRPLYSAPDCRLQVQPLSQALAEQPDALCIGLLQMEFGQWQLAEYIPPCAHLGASPVLAEQYRAFAAEFDEITDRFPKIILHTDAYQEKSMVELREFAMQLGSFAASQRFRYQHIGLGGAPFDMFEFWSAFARQISFLLQCLKDRAGFYNLLNENTRQRNGVFFTAQSWDSAIQNLAGLQYDHNNLLEALKIVNQFLETVTPVFIALSYGVEEIKNRPSWAEEKRKMSHTW